MQILPKQFFNQDCLLLALKPAMNNGRTMPRQVIWTRRDLPYVNYIATGQQRVCPRGTLLTLPYLMPSKLISQISSRG